MRLQLNRDLVRTKLSAQRVLDQGWLPVSEPSLGINDITAEYLNNKRVSYVNKFDYSEVKYSVKLTFEYQGSSCSTRVIEIYGGSVTYKPFKHIAFNETLEVKSFFENYSNDNFLQVQKKVDAVTALSKFLNSTESAPIKISESRGTEEESLAWNLGLETYLYPVIGYPTLGVFSDDDCLINSDSNAEKLRLDAFNKLSSVDKSFYQNFLLGRFNQVKFAQNKKVCKLRVTTSFPASFKNYLNMVEPKQLFGYVWVENDFSAPLTINSKTPTPSTAGKKTITCIKGKSTKKVAGINPKCPSGYKIKG